MRSRQSPDGNTLANQAAYNAWVNIALATLLESHPERGDYLHGFAPTERQLSLEISLPDLADFVVGELEGSRYVHQARGLSYRRAKP
jgi:hypothetical protein